MSLQLPLQWPLLNHCCFTCLPCLCTETHMRRHTTHLLLLRMQACRCGRGGSAQVGVRLLLLLLLLLAFLANRRPMRRGPVSLSDLPMSMLSCWCKRGRRMCLPLQRFLAESWL